MDSTTSSPRDELEILLNTPALYPPPLGTIPVFDNPPNGNSTALKGTFACVAIEVLFSLARVYTRIFLTKKVKIEDYIAVPALVAHIIAACLLARIPQHTGLLVHQWDLRNRDLADFLHFYVDISTCYCVCMILIKASILIEWTHILVPKPNRNFFLRACYTMIFVNSAFYFTIIVTANYACIPREKVWQRWIPGTCINTNAFNIFIAFFNLFFDIIMLLLPHRIIWKLSLSVQQKIGVSVIFSVGIVTCACAAGRVASAFDMIYVEDKTYVYSQHLLWGLAETTTAILVFCVPAFPIAFRASNVISNLHSMMRSKIRVLFYPQTLSSESVGPQPWLQPGSKGVVNGELQTIREYDGPHLMEPRPVATTNGRGILDELIEDPTSRQGGILRTTEIEIIADEESGSAASSIRHRDPLHPWLDSS